jgi:hypothetical protein
MADGAGLASGEEREPGEQDRNADYGHARAPHQQPLDELVTARPDEIQLELE